MTASGDAELIQMVLLHLKPRLPAADFFSLLAPHAHARQLLESYCEQRDVETLKGLYYHANLPQKAAALASREGYRAAEWGQRVRGLSIALQFYEHHATSRDASGIACSQLAKATDEQLRLLEAQRVLERETRGRPPPPGAPKPSPSRHRFVDTPLNETVYKCFCYGLSAAADKLRSDFKAPSPSS